MKKKIYPLLFFIKSFIIDYILLMCLVLTTGTKNTRNGLTRLILYANPSILGWTLGFSSRQMFSASPYGKGSRLLLTASALGFSSRQGLSASPHSKCSRLLLTAGGYLQVAPMPKSEIV